MGQRRIRVGIDTGGTFTDVVAVDDAGTMTVVKTPSTPADPAEGFLTGIRKVLARMDAGASELASVSHGTTVATNQLLEGDVTGIGFITTAGFEHLLEIARQSVPDSYGNSYFWVKPPRIVPADLVRTVAGRIDHTGAETRAFDETVAREAARWFRARGVGTVGVCLLHAYANPEHEQRMRDILGQEHPDAVVSISSDVLREYREYERAMTTLVDAAVKVRVARYVARLRLELDRSRPRGLTGVLFADLDGFKMVNDSLGHDGGDQVLREVARRLHSAIHSSDTVARLGGDEFVVLCRDVPNAAYLAELTRRLAQALSAPIIIDAREVVISASIGIALSDTANQDAENLMRDADTAMHRAKALGKDGYEIFEESLRTYALDRARVEQALRQGLRDDQFVLHFEPIIDLMTEEAVTVESLVRLNHPQDGLWAPAKFISVAEDSGLIVPIGAWVLQEACRRLAQWRARDSASRTLHIAVNLSARQAARPELVDTVTRALADAGLEPQALALELTESVLMEADIGMLRNLERIRDMGVQLGIDDFGTGYSSLVYLKRLPVSFIKIDQSFVSGLTHDPSDLEIVTAVIRLGQALGLTTIAEGVEDDEQLELLQNLGCDQAQGYLLGRPTAGLPDLARQPRSGRRLSTARM